jgi:hypothetical protein
MEGRAEARFLECAVGGEVCVRAHMCVCVCARARVRVRVHVRVRV